MPNDTAKETFDIAIERSRYLLRMATGLTNNRQRRIQKKWASGFKEFMGWSQSQNIDRIENDDVMLIICHNSILDREDFSATKLNDLLRASLVMAVSAVDAYFHAKIIRYIVECSHLDPAPPKLTEYKISVSDFIRGRHATRINNVLRNAIERNLSFQSLQNPDKIADGLALIGISKFWSGVAKRMKEDVNSLKDNISSIVDRRNQIAHGADLSQSTKARNKPREISPEYVEEVIDTLERVIRASEQVIESQLRAS